MARIRTIKPEFWADEDLSALPVEAHMLAAALLNYADDEGYFNANPKLVEAACRPLREDSVSIHECITLLSSVGYLELGIGADGKQYGRIMNFVKHQRINRPTESKIAKLSISWPMEGEESQPTHTPLTEDSSPERNREQGTGKGTGNRESNGAGAPAGKPAKQKLNATDLINEFGVDPEHAAAWLEVRKAKRAPLTRVAMDDLAIEFAKAGLSIPDGIALCAKRSWQGFKSSWDWKPSPSCNQGKSFTAVDYSEGLDEHGKPI